MTTKNDSAGQQAAVPEAVKADVAAAMQAASNPHDLPGALAGLQAAQQAAEARPDDQACQQAVQAWQAVATSARATLAIVEHTAARHLIRGMASMLWHLDDLADTPLAEAGLMVRPANIAEADEATAARRQVTADRNAAALVLATAACQACDPVEWLTIRLRLAKSAIGRGRESDDRHGTPLNAAACQLLTQVVKQVRMWLRDVRQQVGAGSGRPTILEAWHLEGWKKGDRRFGDIILPGQAGYHQAEQERRGHRRAVAAREAAREQVKVARAAARAAKAKADRAAARAAKAEAAARAIHAIG